jgi:glutathione S-transferase
MAIELYWVSGSPFSWRVMLALEVKHLPYESHLLERGRGDLQKPEFLAMSPRGQVPVLRDGEVTVYESLAILAYLDRKYPEPRLFGHSPEEAARVWQAVFECALYLDEPGERFILPLYFGESAEKEGQVREAIPLFQRELARLEEALKARSWVAVDVLSGADLVAYPVIRSLLRAAAKPEAERFPHQLLPFDERYPRLAAWMARIEALPGFDRTFPPHWRNA